MNCSNKTKCYNIVECTTELILFEAPPYLVGDIFCYIQNNCTGKIYKYDTAVGYSGKLEVTDLDLVFSTECTYDLWINTNENTPQYKEDFEIDGITTNIVTFGVIQLYTAYNSNATNYTSELKVDNSYLQELTETLSFKTINSESILGTGNINLYTGELLDVYANITGVDVGSATIVNVYTLNISDIVAKTIIPFELRYFSDNNTGLSGTSAIPTINITLGSFVTQIAMSTTGQQQPTRQVINITGYFVINSTNDTYIYFRNMQSGTVSGLTVVGDNTNFNRNFYNDTTNDITGNQTLTLGFSISGATPGFVIRPTLFKFERFTY